MLSGNSAVWRLAPIMAGLSLAWMVPPAAGLAQSLAPRVATNKGCRESGQNPIFVVDEQIRVTFRVVSSSVSQASATILDYTPDDRLAVLSFGGIATNRTYSFLARIGGSPGVERLVLRAESPALATQRRSCSFTVADGRPGATMTSSSTRTPTATRTAQGSPTVTPTPRGELTGELKTSRGCRENGDAATFAIGDPIIVSFRLMSARGTRVYASVIDRRGDGQQTTFSFGSVPTNVRLSFGGSVGPPVGVHTLRLRATAFGVGSPQTVDTCSFLVEGAAATTTPRASRTRTPARTATATRPRTPTRTFTATPLPDAGVCVGACTDGEMVSVNDLLAVIEIAAGRTTLDACPAADGDGDGQVSLDEVLQAVNNALDGCPNGQSG